MIDQLPDGPDPATDTPAIFSQKAAASVLAQKNMVNQFNASVAAINALFAGGAFASPYTFDDATAAADPGPGKLRLNNAVQSSATALLLDLTSSAVQDVTGLLDQFDAATSVIKGKVRLVKATDPSKWITFDVLSRTAPGGYRSIQISGAWGVSPSPFVNGDPVVLLFQRTGDKGDTGPAVFNVPLIHVREEYGQNVVAPSAGSGAARVLNTVLSNSIAGASLASNQVTLPAGTYDVEATAILLVTGTSHRIKVFNVTDNAPVAIGTTGYSGPNQYSDGIPSRAIGRFTIAAAKVFEVRHYGNSAGGGQSPSDGSNATYAEALFRKVA